MKKRNFTSAKAKEALLPDIKEELKRLEENVPDRKLVESILDGTTKMASDIAKKENEIGIRLYLLRAVIENITLRQAFMKYKVQTATSRNIPTEYADGYPTLVKKIKDKQLFNTYEGFVKLVPREPIDDAAIDWREIEHDFIDFLIKGLEV